MNSPAIPKSKQAFTLIELLVVLVIIALVITMAGPAMRSRGNKAPRQACLSNLKQVNFALILYAQDHSDAFPWHTTFTNGEARVLNLQANAADHFAKLIHYARWPKLYVCPTDPQRKIAPTNFFDFNNSNLSYFASVDASLVPISTNVFNLILSGDRHLAQNDKPVPPALFSATNSAALSWTKELHWVNKQSETLGVLAFADGHCEVVKATRLPATFQRQNLAANRLVLP